MTYQGDQMDRPPQITIEYLRSRAAHYRDLMARARDPRRVSRYRDLSQLLEKAAEEFRRRK